MRVSFSKVTSWKNWRNMRLLHWGCDIDCVCCHPASRHPSIDAAGFRLKHNARTCAQSKTRCWYEWKTYPGIPLKHLKHTWYGGKNCCTTAGKKAKSYMVLKCILQATSRGAVMRRGWQKRIRSVKQVGSSCWKIWNFCAIKQRARITMFWTSVQGVDIGAAVAQSVGTDWTNVAQNLGPKMNSMNDRPSIAFRLKTHTMCAFPDEYMLLSYGYVCGHKMDKNLWQTFALPF